MNTEQTDFNTLDDWLKEPERSSTFQKFMDSLPHDNRSFTRQLREEQRERYVGRQDGN